MKIAVLSRHGRLLALCGLSAALHLIVLQLAARHGAREPAPAPGEPGPLVLRLAPAPSPASAAPPAQSGAAAPIPPAPERTRPAAHASARARPAAPASPPSAQDAPSTPQAVAKPAAATGAGGAPAGETVPVRMPARYRVRMPPSVHLVYSLTPRDAAGKEGPAQTAVLDWRNEDGRYLLRMDGVLGQVEIRGVDSDSGVLPQRFLEQDGQQQDETRFDPEQHRVVFAGGSEAPDAAGIQDRASLLMQLAGIGLARPGQLQDVIEIVVADAGAARIERFQVMGEETIETGDGAVQALRLAQLAPAGAARLEVWLAASRGWLPVQLRLTRADGSSATQVLAAATPAAQ